MNAVLRVIQGLLGLAAINQIFGLGLLGGFKVLFGVTKPTWDIIGAFVSIFVYAILIFLLQKYYEKRNSQSVSLNIRKFAAASTIIAGIAGFIGIAIVVLIVILLFSQIG